jgi:hypothetical protein
MDKQEAIRICLSAHYYLMSNPRFWYEKNLLAASMYLCKAASDLNHTLRTVKPEGEPMARVFGDMSEGIHPPYKRSYVRSV